MVVLLLIVTGDGRVRSEWNSALLSDCVAPAYALLLTSATEIVVWSFSDESYILDFCFIYVELLYYMWI